MPIRSVMHISIPPEYLSLSFPASTLLPMRPPSAIQHRYICTAIQLYTYVIHTSHYLLPYHPHTPSVQSIAPHRIASHRIPLALTILSSHCLPPSRPSILRPGGPDHFTQNDSNHSDNDLPHTTAACPTDYRCDYALSGNDHAGLLLSIRVQSKGSSDDDSKEEIPVGIFHRQRNTYSLQCIQYIPTLGMKKPLLYIKPASHLPETAATVQLYLYLTLPAQPLSPPTQLPHPARASGGREERYEVSTSQGRRKRGREKTRERKNA
jgi:hypothetical protein